MESFGTCIAEWLRRALARQLMRAALRVLPHQGYESNALRASLDEWRAYDRYEGYTLLVGQKPLIFSRWRWEFACAKHLRKSDTPFPIELEIRPQDRQRQIARAEVLAFPNEARMDEMEESSKLYTFKLPAARKVVAG
jgi:hypothetical protein